MNNPLIVRLLESYIGVRKGDDALTWLVCLHVRLHTNQLNITKVADIRPIHKLFQVEKTLASSKTMDPSTTLGALASAASPEDLTQLPLAAFVIETMFSSFKEAIGGTASQDSVAQWYQSYRDLVSLRARLPRLVRLYTQHSLL